MSCSISCGRRRTPRGFDPYWAAEGMSGRDFVYLIFLLAIPNRVCWFTPLSLVGLSVFFLFVSALALREQKWGRSAEFAESFVSAKSAPSVCERIE